MIENGIEVIKSAFEKFAGDGRYVLLYLITLIISVIYIKDKTNKSLLVNYTLIIILIVFNPIIANILDKFLSGGVYWRTFWCIPIGITIAYIFTEVLFNSKVKYKKIIIIICFIGIIIFSGEFVYQNDAFSKVDNWYKLPDEEVEIIYAILENSDKDKTPLVFAPPEINAHIRQITSTIRINYIRNPSGDYMGVRILQFLLNNDYKNAIEIMKYI